MMNTEWQMQTCYTSQTATVRKFLGEGFEPFWGYRCTHKNKADVKMYFRKPPDPIVTELQMLESEPPVVQIDLTNVTELLENLQEQLKPLADAINKMNLPTVPMRAGGKLEVEVDGRSMSEALAHAEQVESELNENDEPDLTQEEVEADIQEMREYEDEREAPAGDQFRVVENVPDLPMRARTLKQDEVIETIRNSVNTNITTTPPDENGKVKVLVADEIIEIYPDGRTKKGKNPAKTSSLAEGV
jgi:hypothetical protein